LPVEVGRLACRLRPGCAAIPHGIARRITGGPIAGRPAGGTDARSLRRPRCPGAGGVLCCSKARGWTVTCSSPGLSGLSRRGSGPHDATVVLVSDNCGARGDLESDQVTFFAFPPNYTSINKPLDLGNIAWLVRRYKRLLLDLVMGAVEATLRNRGPVGLAGSAGAAGAAAAAGGRERAVDMGGALATCPTAEITGEGAIFGDTGGTPRAAGPDSASCVRQWLVRDGSWPKRDDRSPVPSSAAAAQPRRWFARSVEWHGLLFGGRCAVRSGVRCESWCGGEHEAPDGAQRELRCGGPLGTPEMWLTV